MPKMGPIAQWLRLKFIMETCPHYKTRDPHPHASTLRSTTLRLKFSSYWGVWGGWISLCNSTLWGMCWVSLFPFFSVEQQFQLNWDHVKNQAMTLGQNAAPRCPPPHLFPSRRFHWTGMSYDQVPKSQSLTLGLSYQFAKRFCQSSAWICYREFRVDLNNKKSNQKLQRHKKSSRVIPQDPEILYPPQVWTKCLPTNPNPTHPHSCLRREWHEFLREKFQAQN